MTQNDSEAGKKHVSRNLFAENMRRVMKEKKIKLRDVQAATQLNYQYLSAVRHATDNISLDNADKIAEALGEPLHKLLKPRKVSRKELPKTKG